MAVLTKASIRKIASICGPALTEYKIIGVLVERRWVKNEDDFYAKGSDYASGLSHSKAAKIEAIMEYFNRDSTVLAVGAALLSAATDALITDHLDFDDLNRSLGLDGYVYDPRKRIIIPIVGQAEKEIEIQTELEDRLSKLDASFVKIKRGIWDAISSGTSDNLRHALSSSRELLNQVINHLVEGNPEKMTRKERVNKIIRSGSTSEVVNAVAKLVDALYATMSSKEHTQPDFESTVLTARMTEYCLLFVLRKKE